MTLKTLESLGDIVCELVGFLKEGVGVKSSILDKVEDVCKVALPELEHLESMDAEKIASAAYEMAKRIKDSLTS